MLSSVASVVSGVFNDELCHMLAQLVLHQFREHAATQGQLVYVAAYAAALGLEAEGEQKK